MTLFRVHKHFITPEAHFYRQKYKLGDNAVFLTLYANGKSAVRVGGGARQMGPHFFSGNPSPRWAVGYVSVRWVHHGGGWSGWCGWGGWAGVGGVGWGAHPRDAV